MLTATKCRRLHLVDIENLLGDPRPNEFAVEMALSTYVELTGFVEGEDLLVVACGHGAALAVGCCLGGHHRLRVRRGQDGADYELLDVFDNERPEERFDEVVLASGDGIFADRVADLASRGVAVTVVSRPDSLSHRLRFAATAVVAFEIDLAAELAPAVAVMAVAA